MPPVIKPDLVRALAEGFKKEPRLREAAWLSVPSALSHFIQRCPWPTVPTRGWHELVGQPQRQAVHQEAQIEGYRCEPA